jgi:2,3-bisphosphoglycerate-independent phosphoglycerate mutase
VTFLPRLQQRRGLGNHAVGQGVEAEGLVLRFGCSYDVVVVHVEAPDESAHQGMAEEKMKSLERIDQAVVGPLLEALRARGDYRILVAPDHATLVRSKAHDAAPPPFCYAGTGIGPGSGRAFTEAEALATGVLLDPGHKLLGEFLG